MSILTINHHGNFNCMDGEVLSLNDFKNVDVFKRKENLLKKHYKGSYDNLVEKLKKSPNGQNLELILSAVVEEMIGESEDLLSNKLIFTEDNNLSEATDISVKRAGVLAKVLEIVLKKQELSSKSQDVDLNAPAFLFFQEICFMKLTESLQEQNMQDEKIQLIVGKWAEKMQQWPKLLTEKLEAAKSVSFTN